MYTLNKMERVQLNTSANLKKVFFETQLQKHGNPINNYTDSILTENDLPDITKAQPFIYNNMSPLTYIQIRPNNGHLPIKFCLTAYPPFDNYRHIGHNNCISYILPTHHNF